MQICPHCAGPVEDLACACDHCGHSLIEKPIDDALREIDAKLAIPANVRLSPLTELTESTRTAEMVPHYVETEPPASMNLEDFLMSEVPQEIDPDLAAPESLGMPLIKETADVPPMPDVSCEFDTDLAAPLNLETPVTKEMPVVLSSARSQVSSLGTTSNDSRAATGPAGSAGWKRWQVAGAGAALAVVGVVIVIGRPSASPAATSSAPPAAWTIGSKVVPPSAPTVQLPAQSVRTVEDRGSLARPGDPADLSSSRAPKWARTTQAGWTSDGSRMVSFEVAAENEVRVWMKHVRPVLTVRCLGRQTEVFVVTDSAMSIESTPDQHTVHVAFDGQTQSQERWLDSASKRELFAPDGTALARQLAGAQTMRFGFTPYSASPVVADFDVHGFAGPLETVAKACARPSASKVKALSLSTSLQSRRH